MREQRIGECFDSISALSQIKSVAEQFASASKDCCIETARDGERIKLFVIRSFMRSSLSTTLASRDHPYHG